MSMTNPSVSFSLLGANQIETADGQIIKLDRLSDVERVGKAKLLNKNGMKVYRHLIDGDALLVNRQPSLHKASIMAHRARVLQHVKEQTLRLHYANCSSYNADFDGDEMNCHFVQNELARAEAYTICNTDNQYIVPTSGNPIRGLIQDHVSSAVKLTCKNSFLTKAEFQQLLYIAVHGLPGTEIVTSMEHIATPPPTVWKPTPLWTGKQVVSAILAHLCRHPLPPLQLDSKARTPSTAFSPEHNEHEVVIRNGELLFGVIDKNSIGNASLGLVHAVYELYGAELAGRLLNSFARVFTFHLQNAGHSCLIEDLVLQDKSDHERRSLLEKVDEVTHEGLIQFLESDGMGSHHHGHKQSSKKKSMQELRPDLARFLNGTRDRKDGKVKLDAAMQQLVNKSASDVIKACLPNGLRTSFLNNHFALMVMTGAKGSAVNQSQITCFLGQQALEGQRVPVMTSGKTLPSFPAFDGSARAGGFVRDRFLTGVKPQEYYFHCMAGREGLVDTAVKTSRSGYLQRCLVKHLEELNVCYDYTVRDSGNNVVQFLYGEDGIDTLNNALLGGKNNQFLFLARNHRALTYKFSLHAQFFQQGLEMDTATKHHDLVARAKQLVRDTDKVKSDRAAFLQLLAQKGNVVLARRRKDPELPWGRDNILMGWYPAEIVKARSDKDKADKRRAFPSVDLVYYGDNHVEKKVPVAVLIKPSVSSGGVPEDVQLDSLPVYMICPGLPDPAMSALRLGSAVGACSERVQQAFREYVLKNPDGIIEQEGSSALTKTSGGQVSADAMELLLWVKFMRSFAAPGESVGCVAAQSVGEPSTQMTLNTFHLAGHGGANVTLGIPRLREILMTASRAPKTPTMQLPCVPGTTRAAAQALARHLSRLTLGELLDHRGGIIVGEQIVRANAYSRWERKYRLRLQLLPLHALHAAFSVSCDEIVKIVETTFLAKLDYLLKLEQRRAGENTGGKNDPLKNFRGLAPGKTGDAEEGGRRGRGNDEDDGDAGARDGDEKASKNRRHTPAEGEDSEVSDDEDDDSVDSAEENVRGKKHTVAKADSYDEDSDEDETSDSDDESVGKKPKTKSRMVLDEMSVGSMDTKDEEEIDRLVSDLKEFDETAGLDDEDEEADAKKSKKKSSRKSVGSGGSNTQRLVEYSEKEHWIQVTLYLPVTSRRILLAQLAEKAAANTTIRSTKNISRAYVEKDDSRKSGEHFMVGTEGVNFPAIWALPETLVDHNHLQSNDVWQILCNYGVEAARASIVHEIQSVFAVYGIDVNSRHLSLIADFMTRNGGYNALNRIGMLQCASPLLQMSFETTCTFLTRAVQEGLVDNQQSPSSRIVLGSAPRAGTGCFEVLAPLGSKK
jgi:DNA-directed RNA polymerase I subunit RPA1